MQQLYAKIKETSKYYGQTEEGKLFPVEIFTGLPAFEYIVSGNDNAYRLQDVNLFLVGDDGKELKIS